jgi:diguanylate cyclase (GGDEF)-like protein
MTQRSIRSRVIWLTAISMGGLVLLAVTSLLLQQQSNASLRTVYLDRVVPLSQIKAVADAYGLDVVEATYKVRDGEQTPAQGRAHVDAARRVAASEWQAYLASSNTPREITLIEQIQPLLKEADLVALQAHALMSVASRAELRDFAKQTLFPVVDKLAQTLNSMTRLQLELAAQEYERSQQRWRWLLFASIAVTLLLLTAAAWSARALIRSVTRPLANAVRVTEAVAAGDLDVQIKTESNDEVAKLLHAVDRMRTSLVEQAEQDPLTRLLNRRSFERQARHEAQRAQRSDGPWALLMIDIDHFKRLNDSLGHAAGDVALVAVADALRVALRTEDLAARWGGEEFVLLLVGTAPDAAVPAAERVRMALAGLALTHQDRAFNITASIGVAAAHGAMELAAVLQRADEALYAAKAAGRNRVVLAPDSVSDPVPDPVPDPAPGG